MSAETSPSALILEDESTLGTALQLSLRKMGFAPQVVSTIKKATQIFQEEAKGFDLMLLDRQLPDGDSIDFCRGLRQSGYKGMILMLTASGDTNARVEGLRAGADDYLPKPFSWEELEARLEALKKRLPTGDNTSDRGHLWQLNKKLHQVYTPEGWKKLTSIEFKLLSYLIDNSPVPISKEDLLKQVWGLRILPKTRTVDWFIGRLRKIVEKNPKNPEHILNRRGQGYFFRS